METIFGNLNKEGIVEDELKLDLSTIPSSDPLAFGYGLHKGQTCTKHNLLVDHGSKWSELAAEYIRGFLLGYRGILVAEGTKIKKGQEQSYYFFDKNLLKIKN